MELTILKSLIADKIIMNNMFFSHVTKLLNF